MSPKFAKEEYRGRGGKSTFRKEDVSSVSIEKLITNLFSLSNELEKNSVFPCYLITIKYKSIVSKSRRIKRIFKYNRLKPFDFAVGSGYYKKDDGYLRHQITYYVSKENVDHTIECLKKVKAVVDTYFNGVFKSEYMSIEQRDNIKLILAEIEVFSKNELFEWICDVSNIDSFYKYIANITNKESSLITFFSIFNTSEELREFLLSLGLSKDIKCLDGNTAIIKNDYDLKIIANEVPYFVFQELVKADDYDFDSPINKESEDFIPNISKPSNEPIVGVFDSYFDKDSYFSEWVECVPCYHKDIEIDYDDMTHGTKVCNLIVDGPNKNHWLEDNCGRFRIKLFEVALRKNVNTQFIFDNLERIVSENPDIKVWNFSIGDVYSVSMNQISLLGAKIDYVAKKYNVLFVVSGTNLRNDYPNEKNVGAPADSLNALVVNSVDRDGNPALYTRTGPVLTLYTKPDVAYYGGTDDDPLIAYSPKPNDYYCSGTSFAAPLVARKAAYLIHYLHFDPLLAKALIIDAASKWDEHSNMKINHKIGYGVVPKTIKEIIYSDSDEIKFVLSDVTQQYYTKIMTIPVPLDEEKKKFMYTAKATLCCFTEGKRKNGVDYSSIEMELKVGRNVQKYSKIRNEYYLDVDSINKDKQYDEDGYVDENKACIEFQKWNNTKHLIRAIKKKRNGIAPKHGKYWGVSITQIDRLDERELLPEQKYGLKFAVVVTLKQVLGEDAKINSFISECAELKLNPVFVDEAYDIRLYNEENAQIKWK